MTRPIALLLLLIFATAGIGGLAVAQSYPPPPPGYAYPAPRQGGFGSFFGRLFGPRYQTPPPPGFYPPRKIRVAPAEPPLPTVTVVEKDPKARKILVVGDFAAGGLAWGLDQTFAAEPKLSVVDRSNGNSGLVRPDYYDWNKELLGLLNSEKPDIIVMMIGANDRQQLRSGNVRFVIRSEDWEKAYGKRIDGLVESLKVYGRPFFWVSAAPVRTASVSNDMTYINGLFTPRVEAAGGHFVDIWNGFTDENGHYMGSGPDVDGQARALRTGDGVNFTRAGRLKVAFYVAREIRKETGIGAGTVDLLASSGHANQIEIGPDGKKRLVGPTISLGDPLPGASDALAGVDPLTTPASESPQYRLIVKGDALPGVGGRVDDFGWPPGQRAAKAVLLPEAAAPAPEGPALTPVSK
jgi:hypothetical protein